MISCVENKIFVHIYPDGSTFFKFESTGDSTDVFNNDFIHPQNLKGWNDNIDAFEKNDEKKWRMITEGISTDSILIFQDGENKTLNYSFKRYNHETWFSSEFGAEIRFQGKQIKDEFPKLYEALISDNPDSLFWLPEAMMVLMRKGLNEISPDSISPQQAKRNQRLVNHLRNSFAKTQTLDDMKKIQKDRETFLIDLLKPFQIEPSFPNRLAKAMEKHEAILKSAMDLKDDSFQWKILMPGKPVRTNASNIKGDTLIWEFGLDSLLSESFELKAESVIYPTDRIQKTLIFTGLLTLIFVALAIKKRI